MLLWELVAVIRTWKLHTKVSEGDTASFFQHTALSWTAKAYSFMFSEEIFLMVAA